MKTVNLMAGNCLTTLKSLPDNAVDAIVTDPPYGLSFMGKKWDYDVPSTEIWLEALRVLKPGGHLLAFFGTRTYHRGVIKIEDAGFEIRDQIMWIYGSGFPKSHNIKEGDFKGWGSALKPANEPIVVARKPLEKGLTLAANVLKYGTGAINIDASRIGQREKPQFTGRKRVSANGGYSQDYINPNFFEGSTEPLPDGRWPANILFDEAAAELLDAQQDAVSRFFYVAKASKSERSAGLEVANAHPTVKPIKLMQYLIKLVTPPNGIVLDPFMGSGSTGVAALQLGFSFIGCEMSDEYMKIAEARLNVDGAE